MAWVGEGLTVTVGVVSGCGMEEGDESGAVMIVGVPVREEMTFILTQKDCSPLEPIPKYSPLSDCNLQNP